MLAEVTRGDGPIMIPSFPETVMTRSPLAGPKDLTPPYVLLDARSGSDAFRKEHLPGALHADLDRCLSDQSQDPSRGGRHPLPSPEAWARQLGAWGITPATRGGAYD